MAAIGIVSGLNFEATYRVDVMKKTILASLFRQVRLGLFGLALLFGATAYAQDVLSGAQTGTLQLMRQDDGYITISGRNYNFDNEVSKVFLGGDEVDSATLDEGMVVRYTLNRQGVLLRIEIIGPASKINAIEDN